MMKKNFTYYALLMGFVWISLILLAPQFPTGPAISSANGRRQFHPFFTWHLFSNIKEERFIGLSATECPESMNSQKDSMDIHFYGPGITRYQMIRRLIYLGILFNRGDVEAAKTSLKKIVDYSYPQFKGCRVSMYSYSWYSPTEKTLLEGAHIEP